MREATSKLIQEARMRSNLSNILNKELDQLVEEEYAKIQIPVNQAIKAILRASLQLMRKSLKEETHVGN